MTEAQTNKHKGIGRDYRKVSRKLNNAIRRGRFFDTVSRTIALKGKPNMQDSIVVDLLEVKRLLEGKDYQITECLRPPFNPVFFEWRNIGKHRYGVLATTFEPRDTFYQMALSKTGKTPAILLSLDHFTEIEGGAMYLGSALYNLDEAYYMSEQYTPVLSHLFERNAFNLTVSQVKTMLHTFGGIALYALELMNCRNIIQVDHEPNPADSAMCKAHFGKPLSKYKTLAITSIGKHYDHDKPQQKFDVMPMHIRRGHFKRFTAEAPLFGKYVGTFWYAATVVGNEKNGVVDKGYKVKS